MENVLAVLRHWGIEEAQILQHFDVKGNRTVCKIQTENGPVILKGQPSHIKQERILSNIHAHEFLGNLHHMAPKLYYTSDGGSFIKNEECYYYLMEYIQGRQAQETVEDERLLGKASAKLHRLSGYQERSNFDIQAVIRRTREWFSAYAWKSEFDAIVASLPDFEQLRQCFIHTDIGPHNAMIRDGSVVFVDLDDAGCGSLYMDLGWPFIMQFVHYNKETHEMHYRFDLAKAFLEGYMGENPLTPFAYDMLWKGAILMHISYMKSYGKEAEQPLWNILDFGMKQKDALFQMVYDTFPHVCSKR